MGTVFTICPVTGHSIATGVETDQVTFALTPDFNGQVYCHHCQRDHQWSNGKSWVEENAERAGAGAPGARNAGQAAG